MGNEEKPDDEKEVVDYLMRNNGENLHELEENLAVFLEYKETTQSDSNEEASTPLSMEELERMLLETEVIVLNKNHIDLKCFNQEDNALVVVEIKSQKDPANHKTFGQILYYIEIEKDNLKMLGTLKHSNGKDVKDVRGIVLANKKSIKPSLNYLIKKYETVLPKISLKTYRWTDEKKLIIEDV